MLKFKKEILKLASVAFEKGSWKQPQIILALSIKNNEEFFSRYNMNRRLDPEYRRPFSSFETRHFGTRFLNYAFHYFAQMTFNDFCINSIDKYFSALPEWIKIPKYFDVINFDDNWWKKYESLKLNGKNYEHKKEYMYTPLDLQEKPDQEIVKFWDYCAENKTIDYNMCYSIVFTLIKNNIQIKNLTLCSYPYIFIDEFENMTDRQYDFLKGIFKDSKTIVTGVFENGETIIDFNRNFKDIFLKKLTN